MEEEEKKPADKAGGGGPSHRRVEESARDNGIIQQVSLLLKKKGQEECARDHEVIEQATLLPKKKVQEEVSWTWKRKPLQGDRYSIALSCRKKVLDDIQSVLIGVGGEKLLQRFVDGCFGHLMRFIGGISCNKALHELISREITFPSARDDELWFRIGGTNIRFALAEYALVTGLRFGSSSFDPLGSHEMPPDGVYKRLCKDRPFTVRELWGLFISRHLRMSPEDYLKVAHVLTLNLMALGYDQFKTVEPWVWVLVEDLDLWNIFPWGAYTYQALMHFVSILPTKRVNIQHRRGYHFYGPVWALQIWAYEAIPRLANTCALVTEEVSLPRCLKWSFLRGKKLHKHSLDQKLVCHVTLEPSDEERLQPYWLSLQTQQPLGVRYTSRPSRQVAAPRVVATAKRARVPVLYDYLSSDYASDSSPPPQPRHTAPVEPVEVSDTDGSVHSTPKPSARPSRRMNRTWESIYSCFTSLGKRGRPRSAQRWPEAFDEARFVDQVSGRVVDDLAQRLLPQMKQWIDDWFDQVRDQLEKPPGYNAESAKAAEIADENKALCEDNASKFPPNPFSSKTMTPKKKLKKKKKSPLSNKETSDGDEGSESSFGDERRKEEKKKKKKSKKWKRKYSESSSSESSSSDGDRRRRRDRHKRRRESFSESSDSSDRGSRRYRRSRRQRRRDRHEQHQSD